MMDEKLKHTYGLNTEFDWAYSPPMQLRFETDDLSAFDRAQKAVAEIMTNCQLAQISLNNESQK